MTDLRRVSAAALVAAALLIGLPVARAEVGVGGGGGAGSLRLYILASLVDDPDPATIIWARYNADGASRAVLNDGGYANGDGAPSFVVLDDGTPVAAWSRNSPQGFDVVVSRFDGTAWTSPAVLAGEPANEHDPHLFADPASGAVHVVYWVGGEAPHVMHRQAPQDLSSWSVPVQVSEPGQSAFRPNGTIHNGLVHVVYEVHDFGIGTTPRQIVLATGDGQSYTSQMLSITLHSGPNWPEVHSGGGRLWIDWVDAADRMAWMRLLSGSWGPVEAEPFQGAEQRDFHVRGTIRSRALD